MKACKSAYKSACSISELVAFIITSGETTWGYQILQVSRKLEHAPRHYKLYHAIPNSLLEILVYSRSLVMGFAPSEFGLIFPIGSDDRPFVGLEGGL